MYSVHQMQITKIGDNIDSHWLGEGVVGKYNKNTDGNIVLIRQEIRDIYWIPDHTNTLFHKNDIVSVPKGFKCFWPVFRNNPQCKTMEDAYRVCINNSLASVLITMLPQTNGNSLD